MADRKVILTKGLPASGKTTYATEQVNASNGKIKIVSKDKLRAMLDCGLWSKKNEKYIIHVRDLLITDAVRYGFDVIVDDTNLAPIHEERVRAMVGKDADVKIKDFMHVPLRECIARDLKRDNGHVGEAVIRKMHGQYLRSVPPVLQQHSDRPDAIICDLDGTLALFGNANPFDRNFLADELNPAVAAILRNRPPVEELIIVSGRNNKFEAVTRQWLAKYKLSPERLHMRKDGDYRKDSVIKEEIYHECIEDVYNVVFVLDDRSSVVDLWRSLGLSCLQVATGEF